MSNPQITIDGPKTTTESTGPSTDLYLGDEATVDTDTEVNPESFPRREADQTILTPLEGEISFSYSGTFNAQRLLQAGLGSSLEDAMYEWIFRLETLCSPIQGIGYSLDDQLNGFLIDPSNNFGILIEEAEWSVVSGELYRGEWRIEGILSKGVQNVPSSTYRTDLISNRFDRQDPFIEQAELDYEGTTQSLGAVEDFSVTRKVDIQAQQLSHQASVPLVGTLDSGVEETIRVSGQMAESFLNSIGSLSEWSRILNTDLHGTELTLSEPYSKREWVGTVSSSNTTFEERPDNRVSYDLEIDVGTVQIS